MTRTCRRCGHRGPESEFVRGNRSRCKKCHSAQNAAYNKKNPDALRDAKERFLVRHPDADVRYARRRRLASYGLTEDDYVVLLEQQNGLCAVCKEASEKTLEVDHNHETGAVRGLVCHSCNAGMGSLRDDPELLRAAADYLEKAGVRI